MAKTMQVEVWVLIGECEEYAVGCSEEAAVEKFEEDVSSLAEAGAVRRVRVVLTVPVPEAVTLTGTVPAEGAAELTVA